MEKLNARGRSRRALLLGISALSGAAVAGHLLRKPPATVAASVPPSPTAPTQFVIGAYAQPASSFANWQRRGITHQFSVAPDFQGDTATAWFAAATTYSQKLVVGGRYLADGGWPAGGVGSGWPANKPNHYVEAQTNTLIVAEMPQDEYDLNGPSPSVVDAEIALMRQQGNTKPVFMSLRNNTANAILNSDPTPYYGDANVTWFGSDNYPMQGQEPFMFGDYYYDSQGVLHPGPFCTMSGHAAQMMAAAGKVPFQFISTGRVTDSGGVPYARADAAMWRIQAWDSIIGGAAGLICFATYSGSAGFIQDDTSTLEEGYLADLTAKLAILQNQPGGNVLMDTVNGGRRPYTVIDGPTTNGSGVNPTWPTTQPSFNAQVGNQLPAWFRAATIVVGSETFRIVLNLHPTLSKTLTYAPFSITGMVFAPGQVSCFKASQPTVDIFATPAIQTISPGNGWTGAKYSGYAGGVALSAITRVTAQPEGFFGQWSSRIVGQQYIDVLTGPDAGSVKLWVEGNSVTQTQRTLRTETDPNGVSHFVYAFSFLVQTAATAGEIAIFADIIPSDGSMQTRRIGFNEVGYNGDWALSLWPRATQFSNTYDVGSGRTYSTLELGLKAAAAASEECPQILLHDSVAHEMVTPTTWSTFSGGKPGAVIMPAPGVNATLSRSTADFTDTTYASWRWWVGYDGTEFRGASGSSLTLDFKNVFGLMGASQYNGYKFNGCKITCSVGRDSNYWNKASRQDFYTKMFSGNLIKSYFKDCQVDNLNNVCQAQGMAYRVKLFNMMGDIFSGTHMVVGTITQGHSDRYFADRRTGLTITTSGRTNPTIRRGGNVFYLSENGTDIGNITLGSFQGDTYLDIGAVATWISTHTGWTATASDTTFAAWTLMLPATSVYTWGDTAIPVGGLALDSRIDVHSDWWQAYTDGSTARYNVLLINNTLVGADNMNSDLKNDTALKDMFVGNNAFVGTFQSSVAWGGSGSSNVKAWNNLSQNQWYVLNGNADGVCDSYCDLKQNVLLSASGGLIRSVSGNAWPTYPNIANNGVVGATAPGNFAVTGPSDAVVNISTYDLKPAGAVASTLLAQLLAYDGQINARAANDAAGPRSTGYPTNAYPVAA
ncbi:MAG: hypothetical protein JSR98_00680 [Proteobacteria bacterium]|nr:hypothetical protein [Pseudomonadota bacterium]